MSNRELELRTDITVDVLVSLDSSQEFEETVLQIDISNGADYTGIEANLTLEEVKQLMDFLQLHFGYTP